jgi:hypothetical protein
MKKIINNERLRIWVYPKSQGWYIARKAWKPLGYIAWLGRVRLSVTIIKPKMILFNPYTLKHIDL